MEQASWLDQVLTTAMNEYFPLKTYRVRSDDPPWMTHGLRKKIEQRKSVYETDKGKSERWRHMKKLTDKLIVDKKKEFVAEMKAKAIDQRNTGMFYKAVRLFKDHDKPPEWDVRSLFDNKTGTEIADEVCAFFNRISAKFDPVSARQKDTPANWLIPTHEIADMLKHCKKPKS